MHGEQWVDRHRPTSIDEIQGNNKHLEQIQRWADAWSDGETREPLLLYGPPGVGKTSTAFALSNDYGWKLVDINASDERKKGDLESLTTVAGRSINGEWVLVFLDEVDSWPSAPQQLYDMLEDPPCPMILSCNDFYEVPDGIKSKVTDLEFKLGKRSRKALLRKIIEKEGLEDSISQRDLARLVDRANPRAAINDLQAFAEQGEIPWGGRTEEESEFSVVESFVKGEDNIHHEMKPRELAFWLDENITEDWWGLEVAAAHDAISRADIQLDRAFSSQNFRYWKYAQEELAQIADLRLTDVYGGYINVNFPNAWRQGKVDPTKESGEAKLYRELSGFEEGKPKISGSYVYFKNALLPILQDLEEDERRQLASRHNLSDEAMGVLNVDSTDPEEEEGEDEEEEGASANSVFNW